jgi:REP element-mobilizing transposase RayT
MAHTYISCLLHCVWSTKNREAVITPAISERLYPYLAGIAKENGFRILATGGVADHVHSIFSLPTTLPIAKTVQLVKGGSSKWVRETFGIDFAWQEGFGAFSIAISGLPDTRAYLAGQAEHHKTTTFQEEYRGFLERHGIIYDERYVWG